MSGLGRFHHSAADVTMDGPQYSFVSMRSPLIRKEYPDGTNAYVGFEHEDLSDNESVKQSNQTHRWDGNDFFSSQGLDRLYSTESVR